MEKLFLTILGMSVTASYGIAAVLVIRLLLRKVPKKWSYLLWSVVAFRLDADTQRYVLAHERYHIRRLDHIIKPFAFLLLALHWFNPLCWLAFHLMTRDMEMSCDEKVLAGEPNIRRAYSTSLLSFAANRRFPMPTPLAFSESDVNLPV